MAKHDPSTKPGLDKILAQSTAEAIEVAAAMEAETAPPPRPKRLRSLLHRLRRQMYPHYAAAGLLAAGGIAEAIHQATGGTNRVWLALGTALTIGCAVAVAIGIRRLRAKVARAVRRIPRQLRGWSVLCAGVAALWLVVANFQLSTTWAGALVLAEVLLGLRWWRHVRRLGPEREPEPEQTPDEAPQEPTESFRTLYEENVGGKNGALAGSRIIAESVTEHGVAVYDIQGKKGPHTVSSFLTNIAAIGSGTDTPVECLIVEGHPDRKPSRARIKVIERSPLYGDVLFDRPRFNNGIIDIGPYGDLEGEAPYRLYTEGDDELGGSMWSGFSVGDTGIGKSRELENLVTSIKSAWQTHPTVVWFCDPQQGGSSAALQGHADWFVDLDGFRTLMLPALETIMDWRGLENSALGRSGFRPQICICPDPENSMVCGLHTTECTIRPDGYRPGLEVVIEECHTVFKDPEIAERMGEVLRGSRKIGGAATALSQYPGQVTFGGVEPLRSSIFAGNVLAHYASSRLGGALITGLDVDPLTLPRHPQGFGYTQQIGEYGRTAPYRNRLIRNPEWWMAKYPRLSLDPLARNAADYATGGAYSARHTSAEQLREANAELVRAMQEGRYEELRGKRPEPTRSAAATSESEPSTATGTTIIDFGTWPPARANNQAPAESTAGTSTAVADGTAAAAVLRAIDSGASTPGEIAERSGYRERQVYRALAALQEQGLIVKAERGTYTPASIQEPAPELEPAPAGAV